MPLSELIMYVRDMVETCASVLVVAERRLQFEKGGDPLEETAFEIDRTAGQLRKIANRLEICATALRNARGEQ